MALLLITVPNSNVTISEANSPVKISEVVVLHRKNDHPEERAGEADDSIT